MLHYSLAGNASRRPNKLWLQEIRLVDSNVLAVAALRKELAAQTAGKRGILVKGGEAGCATAVRRIQTALQVCSVDCCFGRM